MAVKKPKLKIGEVTNQISKMTGFEPSIAKAILDAYCEITKQAIIGQVEVPLGDIGTISYRQIPPKENYRTWDGLTETYSEPYNKDGYQRTYLRCSPSWRLKQKEITKWPFGEENPMLKLFDSSSIDDEEDELDIKNEIEVEE